MKSWFVGNHIEATVTQQPAIKNKLMQTTRTANVIKRQTRHTAFYEFFLILLWPVGFALAFPGGFLWLSFVRTGAYKLLVQEAFPVLFCCFPSSSPPSPNALIVYLGLVQTRTNWCLWLCCKTCYLILIVTIVCLMIRVDPFLIGESQNGGFVNAVPSSWQSLGTGWCTGMEVEALPF